MERNIDNLSTSANFNDQVLLKENLQTLVTENKRLKEQLAKYEPSYNINFDYDNREVEITIKQLGKVKSVTLSRSDINLSLLDNGQAMTHFIADDLCEIYKDFLYSNFKMEIDKILANVKQLKENNLW